MESGLNTATVFCLAASAVVAVWYLLDYFYVPPHLPDEPPVLSPSIPYIGHIIGLLRHGTRYYQITRCGLSPTSSAGKAEAKWNFW